MSSPFLDYVKEKMQLKRYAKRTIEAYVYWIKVFIHYNQRMHPIDLHDKEVEAFLSYLSNQMNVAPRTQALALNALVFLYKHVLDKPLTFDLAFNKSRIQTKLPVVLTQQEVKSLLLNTNDKHALPVQIMYGSGLRLMEAVSLRIKDIDFDYHAIQVWQGKGGKNRRVTLAKELVDKLKTQIQLAKSIACKDLENHKYQGVWLPYALARKYPQANKDIGWHYLFPSSRLSIDPESKLLRRHHIDETVLRKAVKAASHQANIEKNVTCHSKDDLVKCYIPLKVIKTAPIEYVTKMEFFDLKAA
jgi:integron integrase